jgi:O-antigen/teichoic acid export membrane protein
VESLGFTSYWQRLRGIIRGTDASSARYRSLLFTTLSSVGARGVSMLAGLISVRLTVPYLGAERYGLWMTLSAVLVWASMADLGIGRGLANLLADANGRGAKQEARALISTSLAALATVGALIYLLLALVAAFGLLPWSLMGIPPELVEQARESLYALGAVFALTLPLSVGATTLNAVQMGYVVQMITVPCSIIGTAVVWAAVVTKAGLASIILATSVSALLPNLVCFGYMWFRTRELFPSAAAVGLEPLRGMWRLSLSALIFQLGVLLVNQTQVLVLSASVGLQAAGEFAMLMRVYGIVGQFLFFVDAAFMPVLRNAISGGDRQWALKAVRRFVAVKTGLSLGAGLALVAGGDLVVRYLSKGQMQFGGLVWSLVGVLLVVSMFGGAYSSVLTAVDRVWNQVALVVGNGVVTAGLTLWLGPRMGVLGAVVALGAFTALVNTWVLPWLVREWSHEVQAPVPAVAGPGGSD